jgi:hypothetical protein
MQVQGFVGLRYVDPVSGAGPSCFGEPARRIPARVGGTTVHIVPWAFDTAEMLHNILF